MSDTPYPTSYTDHDAIIAYKDSAISQAKAFRYEIERTGLRNVLYYLGIQWIRYDPTLRLWRPQALRKSTPRPVTNKFASIVWGSGNQIKQTALKQAMALAL